MKEKQSTTIHDAYGEKLSKEQWKALAEAGFEYTRQTVPITLPTTLPRKHGCEGKTHRALKQVAANMLMKLGETQVKLEYDGFDVYGATLGIVIECGNMLTTKIYEVFTNRNSCSVKEIWNLSFPKLENYSVLTKIQFNAKPCNYHPYCKPSEWNKREMQTCKVNGKDCYIRRQYLLYDCLHLNGYQILSNSKHETTN